MSFLNRIVKKYVAAKVATKKVSLESLHFGDKMLIKHYLKQASELPELVALLDQDKHHAALKSIQSKLKAKTIKELAQRLLDSR